MQNNRRHTHTHSLHISTHIHIHTRMHIRSIWPFREQPISSPIFSPPFSI